MEINREYVRSIVVKNNQELRDVSSNGGNIGQKSLDQQDALQELTKDWSEEDQTLFYDLYVEELEAMTAHMNNQTMEILAKTEAETNSVVMITSVIVAVVTVVALIIIVAR